MAFVIKQIKKGVAWKRVQNYSTDWLGLSKIFA